MPADIIAKRERRHHEKQQRECISCVRVATFGMPKAKMTETDDLSTSAILKPLDMLKAVI